MSIPFNLNVMCQQIFFNSQYKEVIGACFGPYHDQNPCRKPMLQSQKFSTTPYHFAYYHTSPLSSILCAYLSHLEHCGSPLAHDPLPHVGFPRFPLLPISSTHTARLLAISAIWKESTIAELPPSYACLLNLPYLRFPFCR